ncbi:YggS family pyridoxal phosphate-dependent enzyme [Flavobacteriaceae bacterium]|jgi:PLP dependent protein|nr:YggS family pyridoxal phosphate-dependent enzyme [Flavobacteriaceae bacterium]
MSIKLNLAAVRKQLINDTTLVAVSKTKPVKSILEAYQEGQRVFGENKVQDMVEKYHEMPKDIHWHMIGHLQRNKVKYIASFVTLIHGIDNFKLLKEINKQAIKHQRVINCLFQIKIAAEDSKFGMTEHELISITQSEEFSSLKNIQIIGLMGMATFTDNKKQIKEEFLALSKLFKSLKKLRYPNMDLRTLSMGMSGDFKLAMACGSNMVRIGSTIFGSRQITQST